MKKQLRVGFDLDGVILYNPTRILRPIIAFVKKNILGKKNTKFYSPSNELTKSFWYLVHKSSLFPSQGVDEIKKLVRQKKIKAYIVSSRYSFLKNDFEKWIKKMRLRPSFSGFFYNRKDEQPHFFKEKMLRKLKLDIFVEDNWDIVNYLNSKVKNKKSKIKVFWVANFLDGSVKYRYKFTSLEKTIDYLKQERL